MNQADRDKWKLEALPHIDDEPFAKPLIEVVEDFDRLFRDFLARGRQMDQADGAGKLIPVIVMTEAGYCAYGTIREDDLKDDNLWVYNARTFVWWDRDEEPDPHTALRTFAVNGPKWSVMAGGPAAPRLFLRDVSLVIPCTEEAAKAWREYVYERNGRGAP